MRGEGNHKIPGSFAPENREKTGAERVKYSLACQHEDAILIKFVSYAQKCPTVLCTFAVALRKESVDRNLWWGVRKAVGSLVALRKESVDRNPPSTHCSLRTVRSLSARRAWIEMLVCSFSLMKFRSLSARRAWIEMTEMSDAWHRFTVALRKESVDRNVLMSSCTIGHPSGRSPQGERG